MFCISCAQWPYTHTHTFRLFLCFPPWSGVVLPCFLCNADLWLKAAKYEFETVYSIESARHVLQKGISFNKSSQTLWHEVSWACHCLVGVVYPFWDNF